MILQCTRCIFPLRLTAVNPAKSINSHNNHLQGVIYFNLHKQHLKQHQTKFIKYPAFKRQLLTSFRGFLQNQQQPVRTIKKLPTKTPNLNKLYAADDINIGAVLIYNNKFVKWILLHYGIVSIGIIVIGLMGLFEKEEFEMDMENRKCQFLVLFSVSFVMWYCLVKMQHTHVARLYYHPDTDRFIMTRYSNLLRKQRGQFQTKDVIILPQTGFTFPWNNKNAAIKGRNYLLNQSDFTSAKYHNLFMQRGRN